MVLPLYREAGFTSFNLGTGQFVLLVLATLLVTAGGYIINDLYDLPADQINKPKGIHIHHFGAAVFLYVGTQMLTLLVSLYLAFSLHYLIYLWLLPIAVGGLWLYTVQLKHLPMLGNAVVAAFCAGVPLLVWLSESRSYGRLQDSVPHIAQVLSYLMWFYAAFAFLSTLARELIKDVQDVPGDKKIGSRTAPIVWGVEPVQWGVGAITFLLLSILIRLIAELPVNNPLLPLMLALVLVGWPVIKMLGYFLGNGWRSIIRPGQPNAAMASRWAKLAMAGGLLLLPVLTSFFIF